ncbi:MAG: hypothetical protein ABWY37_03360 [Microbacterium pygmaeum]
MVSRKVRVIVDGETFEVVAVGKSTHFTWVSGPNRSYGFSIGKSTTSAHTENMGTLTDEEVRSAISGFLSGIDPRTGYLAD